MVSGNELTQINVLILSTLFHGYSLLGLVRADPHVDRTLQLRAITLTAHIMPHVEFHERQKHLASHSKWLANNSSRTEALLYSH